MQGTRNVKEIGEGQEMSSKGAEADLYLEEWFDKKIIRKYRVNKEYRVPELDKKIREFRTVREARLLHDAKRAGVPTPFIYEVDLPNTTIRMEYIEGPTIKNILGETSKELREKLCLQNWAADWKAAQP